MRGKIKYQIWTVMGDREITVKYDIKLIGDDFGIGSFKAEGDMEHTPEMDRAINEAQEEITLACVEDVKRRKRERKVKKSVFERPDDYPRVLPGNLWGAN